MLSKQEKLGILNSFFIKEYDCEGSVLLYLHIENKHENVQKLLSIGVPEEEIKKMTSNDGEDIDISVFAFRYGGAECYQNEEFLSYVP